MAMQYFHRYSDLAYVHMVQFAGGAAVQLPYSCMPPLLTAGALFSHTIISSIQLPVNKELFHQSSF